MMPRLFKELKGALEEVLADVKTRRQTCRTHVVVNGNCETCQMKGYIEVEDK